MRLIWYHYIADVPRVIDPHIPAIMEKIVRPNSNERISEEFIILSTKCSSLGTTFSLESFLCEDFLLFFIARLCLKCRSCGLILAVNPIPAIAKVKTIVSVMLGGIAQKLLA